MSGSSWHFKRFISLADKILDVEAEAVISKYQILLTLKQMLRKLILLIVIMRMTLVIILIQIL